jgi:putative Holliday junction resolvase
VSRSIEGKPLGIIAIEELPARLVDGRTLAGLVLGDKRFGVAVSDKSLSFAHPRPVIVRKKFSIDAAALLSLLAKENAGAVAIGLPINMDGSEGPRAQASRAFVRNMAGKTDLPFVFWDERLSTVAAERTLIEMDFSRKKRAGKIDSAAAAFILQGVLDRLHAIGEGSGRK